MTVSIPNLKCSIYKKYLYNLENNSEEITHCRIIGISAYINQPLTFHVLVEESSIFSNVPIQALVKSKPKDNLSVKSISFLNCPSYNIDVSCMDYLKDKSPNVFFVQEGLWKKAQYLFTIDFYTDNELVHFLLLESGEFSFAPNHKINWSGESLLPNYKKLKQNWSI